MAHVGCALTPSASDGSGHPEGQPCPALVDMVTVQAAARAADVVILALGLDDKQGGSRSGSWMERLQAAWHADRPRHEHCCFEKAYDCSVSRWDGCWDGFHRCAALLAPNCRWIQRYLWSKGSRSAYVWRSFILRQTALHNLPR